MFEEFKGIGSAWAGVIVSYELPTVGAETSGRSPNAFNDWAVSPACVILFLKNSLLELSCHKS